MDCVWKKHTEMLEEKNKSEFNQIPPRMLALNKEYGINL